MKIRYNQTQPFTRNLKPLSDYKGPILKLTQEDNEAIAQLQQRILNAEATIYNLNKKFKPNQYNNVQDRYAREIGSLEQEIQALKINIRDIKIKRFNIQKGENLDTTV